VRLEVADDGVGIPESFDFEGATGFGLRLVHMLAKQLGGAAIIDREGGTRVVMEFPVGRETERGKLG
jgi:two-component sensor histidine kinase